MNKFQRVCAHMAIYSQLVVMVAYGYVLQKVWKALFGNINFILFVVIAVIAIAHFYCFTQYEKWVNEKTK